MLEIRCWKIPHSKREIPREVNVSSFDRAPRTEVKLSFSKQERLVDTYLLVEKHVVRNLL